MAVRFCSITKPNQTIGVRLDLIEFWFEFVRLETQGLEGLLSGLCSKGAPGD